MPKDMGFPAFVVKSGNSSKKKSLKVYGDIYNPKILIRSSPMNLRKDGDILNCPLYLIEELRSLIAKAQTS